MLVWSAAVLLVLWFDPWARGQLWSTLAGLLIWSSALFVSGLVRHAGPCSCLLVLFAFVTRLVDWSVVCSGVCSGLPLHASHAERSFACG